jgi:hypothetical protein
MDEALNRIQNFLKHADRDPEGTLAYVEEATVLYLFEAVELAYRVLRQDPREFLAFRLWFIASYPDLILPPLREKLMALAPDGLDQTDRDLWSQWLAKG